MPGRLGDTPAEVELTKKLAATLVKHEVMEPMAATGWGHGTPPSKEQVANYIAERARADGAPEDQIAAFLAERGVQYVPPASGQPARSEGAPAVASTPTAPAQGGQPDPSKVSPAPAPVAKTDVPDANLEAARNLLTLFEGLKGPDGKYMGKYPDLGEALKGAGHLANMAKTQMKENEQLRAQLAAAPGAASVAVPPVAVPAAAPAIRPFSPASHPGLDAAQARLDKVLSKVTNDGFDGDSAKEFAEANREVAKQQALAVADEQRQREQYSKDAESQRWDAVGQYMATKYPDSLHVNDDEFGAFLATNPLLTEAMTALRAQGRDTRAAELGYTEFVKARGTAVSPARADAARVEADLAAREQVRIELRDKALIDAGIVKGSAGGSSSVETPGITGPSQQDIDAAGQRMMREGVAPGSKSAAEWRAMTITRFLPPELFGPRPTR